eukprot:gene1376-11997_t
MSEAATKEVQATCDQPKSKLVTFVLSIMLGGIGVDRFYTGYILFGILKLTINIVSCGVCGWIWWLIDWIAILSGSWNSDAAGCKFKQDF